MRFRLSQTAVYWPPARSPDGFGRPTYGAPVEVPCRWEDTSQETIGADMDVRAGTTMFCSYVVEEGGLVMLGTLDDVDSVFPENPKEDGRVHEITRVSKIPNLKATQTLVVASVTV